MEDLQEREAYLLRILGYRRYLHTGQIKSLFYADRADDLVRKRLQDLLALKFVDRCAYTSLSSGRDHRPFTYWLTGKGAAYVRQRFNEEVTPPRGRKHGEAYDPTVEHTLAINSLWDALVLAWRQGHPLMHVDWRDEWRGALLKLPLLSADPKKPKTLHHRPDAFVLLRLATAGELPAVPVVEEPAAQSRWTKITAWDSLFPDFAPTRVEGVSKWSPRVAFVEMDLGRASEEQLRGKLSKYHFVHNRPEWPDHYQVPRVGPEKRPLWPGMLVLTITERRLNTLARIFADPKEGYEGWILLACLEWDEEEVVTVGEGENQHEDRRRKGLVRGPCWWDPRQGRSHLTLTEALLGV